MLLLEIKLDQIRPRRDYWRQLGNHKWQLFYLISKQVGGSKSVCAFYRFDAVVQGHQELSGESDENNPLKPNQSAPSIYIMIELCYFSLVQ